MIMVYEIKLLAIQVQFVMISKQQAIQHQSGKEIFSVWYD